MSDSIHPFESPIVVLGAGGHALSVISAALFAGMDVAGIYDDDPDKAGKRIFGIPIIGPLSQAPSDGPAFVAIADNHTRRDIVEHSSRQYVTIMHPNVTVAHEVEIGQGVIVMAGCILQPRCVIGAHAALSAGTLIPHEGRIGAFAHLGPGVSLGGAVIVEDLADVGAGASILPGVTIGEGAVVGSGAVVLSDVPPGTTVVGNPARIVER